MQQGAIGIFDSGYGGLTVMKELVSVLPEYDYVYLGDNARAPYGNRSFEAVYAYTLQCVTALFDMGCPLVILACNTASAKALRNIQQRDLQRMAPQNRVLGVIRPTTEVIGTYSKSGHLGILATEGTVLSESYVLELHKFYPELHVLQQACPMWVPLVENNEIGNDGTRFFVAKYLDELFAKDPMIDTLLLACTHYPLLESMIKSYLPDSVRVISQGPIVADSLYHYLKRHPEIETRCTKGKSTRFYTTDSPELFARRASQFYGKTVDAHFLHMV